MLEREETYEGYGVVAVNIIAHGDNHGHLRAMDSPIGWHLPDIVGAVSDVTALLGKPKLFFANACRGCKYIWFAHFYPHISNYQKHTCAPGYDIW